MPIYLPPPAQAQAHPAHAQAQAQLWPPPPPPRHRPLLLDLGGGGGGFVTDVIPPVKRSTLDTTLLDTFCTPPTIEPAKAEPGSVGIVVVRPVPDEVDLGTDTVCPLPELLPVVVVLQGR
jgi:hypothetical protein